MFEDKILQILSSLDVTIERAKQRAVQEIYGETVSRIFDKGLDAKGQAIGTYSQAYKEVRKKEGLQTSTVDLTFTTKLNKSISSNDNQVFFSNDYGTKVSAYNETRFNKRIFAPTQEDRNIFITILEEELDKLWKS